MGHLHRRLIAFDLDGTLIDSHQDLADSTNELITELGGHALSVESVGTMVGEGATVLVRRALAAAALEFSTERLQRFLQIYDTRLLNHTRLYPGIKSMLTRARALGSLAVLTNKPIQPTERILSAMNVRGMFDYVVGGDGPHPRKPDPAALTGLMQAAGAGTETTLLVGDSGIDRETARRAGVFCCLVTYGFGKALTDPGDRESIVPDAAGLQAVLERFAAG